MIALRCWVQEDLTIWLKCGFYIYDLICFGFDGKHVEETCEAVKQCGRRRIVRPLSLSQSFDFK